MSSQILIGDCLVRMKELADNSVDSVVCDPPYHLIATGGGSGSVNKANRGQTASPYAQQTGFMGMKWDGGDVAFRPETWAEVLRVLKPGGHLVAFSGTRTYHRMAVAIEDAGFEVRDMISWIYGSGFPKSHDISKAIDRDNGHWRGRAAEPTRAGASFGQEYGRTDKGEPITDEARKWSGYGTALKPATEPICLARKPLSEKSIAANVMRWGTGALNIDGCRIETADDLNGGGYDPNGTSRKDLADASSYAIAPIKAEFVQPLGRWPANLCHDGSDEVLAGFPDSEAGQPRADRGQGGIWSTGNGVPCGPQHGDSGSAARFFYTAKTSSAERGEGNSHPTVKPIALMQWLCRLVTPKGGTVLDPFMGSGSTLIAADAEQFNAIGCELSPEYAAIAERRIREAAGLFADVKVAA